MTPSQVARLALGDLADLRHHLERANHFRNQAFERLQELVDGGHTDEVETVCQSAIYQELINEAEAAATLKNTSGC